MNDKSAAKVEGADPWIHRSENMRCKTCIWFVPKVPAAVTLARQGYDKDAQVCDLGRCRRHAPTMGGYPVVFVNDWCGDHCIDENKFRRG
jgi:Pyruvate/2-oxoacid:ferredoxin oxidoreductase delta subunit